MGLLLSPSSSLVQTIYVCGILLHDISCRSNASHRLLVQHHEDSQALLSENSTSFREYCVMLRREAWNMGDMRILMMLHRQMLTLFRCIRTINFVQIQGETSFLFPSGKILIPLMYSAGWLWRACTWVTIMHHAWITKDASDHSLSHLHHNLYLSHISLIFLVHALQ